MNDFLLDSYDYFLPQDLIATNPANPRSSGKLLVYYKDSGKIEHHIFADFCDIVPRDFLLLCNDTKVLKARLFGYKDFENLKGKREIFFHRPISQFCFLAQIKGKVKQGDKIFITPKIYAQILKMLDNGMREVQFFAQRGAFSESKFLESNISESGAQDCENLKSENCKISNSEILDSENSPLNTAQVFSLLEKFGHTPLPPYIKRADDESDKNNYQSVFAKNLGAVAAPTASLHFSESDFAKIAQNYAHEFVTLHIGAGTFLNVETSDIREHKMHSESFFISPKTTQILKNAPKVLCIGTTAARTLEYFMRTGKQFGDCDLFLNPHNKPQFLRYLLTNFHLPKSTLLMLVSSLIGREKTLEIYEIAKNNGYKFYSYGDAMIIL